MGHPVEEIFWESSVSEFEILKNSNEGERKFYLKLMVDTVLCTIYDGGAEWSEMY